MISFFLIELVLFWFHCANAHAFDTKCMHIRATITRSYSFLSIAFLFHARSMCVCEFEGIQTLIFAFFFGQLSQSDLKKKIPSTYTHMARYSKKKGTSNDLFSAQSPKHSKHTHSIVQVDAFIELLR